MHVAGWQRAAVSSCIELLSSLLPKYNRKNCWYILPRKPDRQSWVWCRHNKTGEGMFSAPGFDCPQFATIPPQIWILRSDLVKGVWVCIWLWNWPDKGALSKLFHKENGSWGVSFSVESERSTEGPVAFGMLFAWCGLIQLFGIQLLALLSCIWSSNYVNLVCISSRLRSSPMPKGDMRYTPLGVALHYSDWSLSSTGIAILFLMKPRYELCASRLPMLPDSYFW